MVAQPDLITELKADPLKWVGFGVFFLFCIGMGFRELNGGVTVMGFIGIAWGTIGMAVTIGALFSKRFRLRLTPQGFEFGTFRKRYFYPWSDIAVFGVGTLAGEKVCFTFRQDFQGEERVRRSNQANVGFDRFLPETYGKPAWELAKLLEEWRRRYSN
jgi:hypothetical protein